MVPVPQVLSWDGLNLFLLEGSRNDEQRLIGERAQTVGAGNGELTIILHYGEFFLMGSGAREFVQGGLFGQGWAGGNSP
jgi:hypothetical protein